MSWPDPLLLTHKKWARNKSHKCVQIGIHRKNAQVGGFRLIAQKHSSETGDLEKRHKHLAISLPNGKDPRVVGKQSCNHIPKGDQVSVFAMEVERGPFQEDGSLRPSITSSYC